MKALLTRTSKLFAKFISATEDRAVPMEPASEADNI